MMAAILRKTSRTAGSPRRRDPGLYGVGNRVASASARACWAGKVGGACPGAFFVAAPARRRSPRAATGGSGMPAPAVIGALGEDLSNGSLSSSSSAGASHRDRVARRRHGRPLQRRLARGHDLTPPDDTAAPVFFSLEDGASGFIVNACACAAGERSVDGELLRIEDAAGVVMLVERA